MGHIARLGIGVCCLLACVIACRRGESSSAGKSLADAKVELTLAPSPPAVGDADVTVTLTSAAGEPIQGAAVRVEGNMNHAGMRPSLADLKERSPGRYAGTLEFTMGGDWFILVTAKTSDGGRIERKIDVPAVKSRHGESSTR